MDKDKKNSPGAEGYKLTRFGSTGKATFQATNPPKFDHKKTLTSENITVADISFIPDHILEKVAATMKMNSAQLFLKAMQNQRRMAAEEGKLGPTDIVYTEDDIPKLIAITEQNAQNATNGNAAAPECDGHTTGGNEQDASVPEEGLPRPYRACFHSTTYNSNILLVNHTKYLE
ncbi:hypothetical protein FVER53590_25768 [Fusarium verticillioides]|nr:hypothetical protein FVER14953_20835 [Fusarium verticillioides]RBR20463.1 hypothetical protein FVER53590_25768 [Fusarium verticillioides]